MRRFPYLLDEFTYLFETPFEITDPDFPECKIDRPSNASPDDRLYLVNHNLQIDLFGILIPNRALAPRTNSATGRGSIGAHADLCTSIYGRKPDVVLVDWVNVGEVMKAQSRLNGF